MYGSRSRVISPPGSRKMKMQFLAQSLELPGLQLVRTEHPVDSFSADIVCKIIGTDDHVMIENQLERTNHEHVGQLLTYSAKFDAKIIVWIAQRFTDAHRAALDWLNEISSEEYGFFGVEVRAVQIENSPVAPLFDVVAKPNEWTKPELSKSASNEALTDAHRDNIEFWELLDKALAAKGLVQRRVQKQIKGQNMWIPLTGDGGVYIVPYRAFGGTDRISCYLGLYDQNFEYYYKALLPIAEASTKESIASAKWHLNSTETVRKLLVEYLPVKGISVDKQIEWLVERINDFAEEFAKPAQAAELSKPQP